MIPAIEIENMSKMFSGKILALDDISFKVKKKSALGYLGPNGAGKSTTIKILTNILKPSKGTARIYDYDVQKDPMKALQLCGTILEVPEFYGYLTPRETMIYLGKVRGMKKAYLQRRIKEVMEAVEMEEWVDVKIKRFSTGMRQRTAIAQAMLHEPPVLILDEPTNGLDPRGMAQIRDLINRLKKDRTILLSSHLLNEVELICDTVILLNRGQILASDSVAKIQKLLTATQIKVMFLDSIDEIKLKKIENQNEVHGVSIDNGYYLIDFDGSDGASANILDFLVKDLELKVSSFAPIGKGLEDFYIDLIEQSSNGKITGGRIVAKK